MGPCGIPRGFFCVKSTLRNKIKNKILVNNVNEDKKIKASVAQLVAR